MNLVLTRLRRTLLRALVPELVWPRQVILDGAAIPVRGTPFSFGYKRELVRGVYEADERRVLASIIQPGDVVIEMGGSIGILTAIMAHRAGPTGRVISLEASDQLTAFSRTWLETRGNVTVATGFGFPVWRLRHRVDVENFEALWGSMSGRVTFRVGEAAESGAEGPVYDVGRLAALAPRPPVALVVDIEGSERILAHEPPALPPSIRHFVIELHPHMYGAGTRAAIVKNVEADGFRAVSQQGEAILFQRPA